MDLWYNHEKKSFLTDMTKMKNVDEDVLKVLTYVRTPPEELLGLKKNENVSLCNHAA